MSELTEFRQGKDQFFARDSQSPLLPEQQKHFRGLEYFPENPHLRLVLTLQEFPESEKEPIEMVTSTGDTRPHRRWGSFTFHVDGEEAALTVYQGAGQDELFLPFADATSGKETYGAGRYLDILPANDGRFLMDFNYAYNPYCAYNPHWTCPIPPAENRLEVPIRAGEKSFPDAGGH